MACYVNKQDDSIDWLPERARWRCLARLGVPAVSTKKNFPENLVMNPVLSKLYRLRLLDAGFVLFLRVDETGIRVCVIKTPKKKK